MRKEETGKTIFLILVVFLLGLLFAHYYVFFDNTHFNMLVESFEELVEIVNVLN